MPVTPLLGRVFGTIDSVFGGVSQRKITFPGDYGDIAAQISALGAPWRGRQQVDEPPIDFGIPTLPVVLDPIPEIFSSNGGVREVFPGPVGVRPAVVPRKVVVVEDVSTEVEEYEQGDFPAGSIFAPGRTWGQPAEQHDLDATIEDQEMAIDWGGLVEGVVDIFTGQAPWQGQQQIFGGLSAQVPATVPAPSGIPGQPTTIYGYKAGTAVTSGDMCGNRRYVTLDRETGKISCKRRRRRRLLTNRDLADLASLKTITGGGAALNSAVIRAVR